MAHEFKYWQCHDDRGQLTREDAIKRTLAFAYIHDCQTENEVSEAFEGLSLESSHLEGDEGTVWTVSSGTLNGAGDGATQWWPIRHTEAVTVGFVATFEKTGDRGAFLFCCDDSYNAYMAWWKADAVGFSILAGPTSETILTSIPWVETGSTTITVAVQPKMYTKIDEIDDLAMAMWFDDKLVATYLIEYETKGSKTGFACYDSDIMTIDNYHIPQLHQIQEWTSVDPGETAAASMGRVIGQSLIRTQARYNGSVKMWYNDSDDIDWTVPASRAVRAGKEHSFYSPGHFRLVGALHEVNTFRDNDQGHTFQLGNDPNALSQDEVFEQGGRMHERITGQADQLTIDMAPNPVLEPEDIVAVDSIKWKVTTIRYQITWQATGMANVPVLRSTVQARKNV